MINVLNRLAWGLSFCLGISFASAIFPGNFIYGGISIFIVTAFMAALVIKRIFFSIHYLESALTGKFAALNQKYRGRESEPAEPEVSETAPSLPPETRIVPPVDKEPAPAMRVMAEALADKLEDLVVSESLLADAQSEKKEEAKQIPEKEAASPRRFYSQPEKKSEARVIFEREELEGAPASDPVLTGASSAYSFFADFFRENALAKIGGILLFLAVLFLMQLVYTHIGPIGKLLLGFFFGFIVFGIALWLEAKNYYRESRVLMGISILINYLVILSGRYLIGEGIMAKQFLLNESICLFLLIVNTIFAISVAVAHDSRVILFFSFVAAYANPFLVSEEFPLSVYAACAYGLLVSLGAFYLSRRYFQIERGTALALFWTAFVGGNLLSLSAPSDSAGEWLIKLALLSLLSLIAAFQAYRQLTPKTMALVLSGAYAFFFVLVMQGQAGIGSALRTPFVTISALLFMLLASSGAVFGFMQANFGPLLGLLLLPMLLILVFFQLGVLSLASLPMVSTLTLLFYVIVFALILGRISRSISFAYYAVLAFFVFLLAQTWRGFGNFGQEMLSDVERYGIAFSLALFLASALYFSRKKGLAFLYPLSVFATAFNLPLILENEGAFRSSSLLLLALFLVIGLAWPFINRQLFEEARSAMYGFFILSLFAVYEIFYFSSGATDLRLGLYFTLLAVLFFGLSYLAFLFMSARRDNEEAPVQREKVIETVYPLLGISISLFSLAIAYLFSGQPGIVAIVYFIEASLIFYFYSQRSYQRIYVAGLLMMLVGIIKLAQLLFSVEPREYGVLFASLFLLVSLGLSLRFLKDIRNDDRLYHDLLHIVSVILVGAVILEVVPDTATGWNFMALAVYGFLLSIMYSLGSSKTIISSFVAGLMLVLFYHIAYIEVIYDKLQRLDLGFYMVFQYVASLFFLFPVLAFRYLPSLFGNRDDDFNEPDRLTSLLGLIYAVIISTQYLYLLFDKNVFVITIYWGIISLILLSFGIQRDRIKYRTIGLYILVLTVAKILLYDIWSGLDDAIFRVFALMLVGAVMIAVSTLYSRKYGSQLSGEFDPKNLIG